FIPDSDADGVDDIDELNCGGDPGNASTRPERLDTPEDDNGNTLIDEPLPAASINFDCDGDGFTGTTEDHVYFPATRGNQDPCGMHENPHAPIGWPADLQGTFFSFNKINILDLSSFVSPVRRFNSSPGDPNFETRWDVLPGTTILPKHINIQDIAAISLLRPPMLIDKRAFGGPNCPSPP
ncbi:MAG: hypothetical protein ACREUU_20925, partial [Gammaproteobacteria bacterium]